MVTIQFVYIMQKQQLCQQSDFPTLNSDLKKKTDLFSSNGESENRSSVFLPIK